MKKLNKFKDSSQVGGYKWTKLPDSNEMPCLALGKNVAHWQSNFVRESAFSIRSLQLGQPRAKVSPSMNK